MKKTNTKKSASTKKSPVAAKAVTPVVTETTKKKVAVKKSAPKKTSPAKTTVKKTVAPKVAETKKPVQKKVTPVKKVAPVKKAAPTAPKVEEKTTSHVAEKSHKEEAHEGVKMLGIFHFVANVISGGTFGIIVVLAYFLWKKSELSQLEKETCFEILNFNISFLLYTLVLAISVVGIVLIPFLALAYLVLLVLGFMSHLNGKNYKYSLVIRFLP